MQFASLIFPHLPSAQILKSSFTLCWGTIGQIQPTDCFCTACWLKRVFMFIFYINIKQTSKSKNSCLKNVGYCLFICRPKILSGLSQEKFANSHSLLHLLNFFQFLNYPCSRTFAYDAPGPLHMIFSLFLSKGLSPVHPSNISLHFTFACQTS